MDELNRIECELRASATELRRLGQHDKADRAMHLAALAMMKRQMLAKVDRIVRSL